MSTSPNEQLELIESMIREGELKTAEKLAKELENDENLDVVESLRTRIAQLSILVMHNDLEKAIMLADIIIDLSEELQQPIFTIDGMLYKIEALMNLMRVEECEEYIVKLEDLLDKHTSDTNSEFLKREIHYAIVLGGWFRSKYDFETSLAHYNRALSLNDKLNDNYYQAVIYRKIADAHFYSGNLDLSMQNYNNGLQISTEFNFRRNIAHTYLMIAGIRFKEDQLKEALKLEKQSIAIWEELEDEYQIALSSQHLAFIYNGMGELEKSLKEFEKSKEYFSRINRPDRVAYVLLNIGHVQQLKGEYDIALAAYDEYYKFSEEVKDELNLGIGHNRIGRVLVLKGELDEALLHFERAMNIIKQHKMEDTLGEIYFSLGELYLKKADLKKSMDYHLQSLNLREKMKISDKLSKIASSLKCLIVLCLFSELNNEAMEYLDRLELLSIDTDNVIINQLYQLSKAILCKYSESSEENVEAKNALVQMIEEDIVDYNISVEVILHLCEILLLELSSSSDLTILDKVKGFIVQLIDIASKQNLFALKAEAYLLQAQLSLIELKTSRAQQLLVDAQKIAEDKGIHRLAIRISNEHDQLLDKLDHWTEFTMKLPSIAEKLELTHIEEMLNQMIKKRMIDIETDIKEEELPALFLVLNETGSVLYTEVLNENIDENSKNEFIENIHKLILENEPEIAHRKRFHDYTYLLRKMDPCVLCYAFIGKSYSGLQKLHELSKVIGKPSPLWDILMDSNDKDKKISYIDSLAISKSVANILLKEK